jgi:hypothetical protein
MAVGTNTIKDTTGMVRYRVIFRCAPWAQSPVEVSTIVVVEAPLPEDQIIDAAKWNLSVWFDIDVTLTGDWASEVSVINEK